MARLKGRWAEDDLQLVRWLYPHVKTQKIADLLGRGCGAVYQVAAKMGLAKSREYLASEDACRLRQGEHVGRAFQFAKGHVPANKGLRRPGYAPGRMRETQFRKGERKGKAAENWCPVGTIRADGEGFLRIKVRHAASGEAYGFGNTKVWPLLNRHIWEQHHGPIPPSHAICFKDGKRANCDIGNLECVSRADLARRNSMWNRYPPELARAIQMNGALKRKLRRLTRAEKQDD